MITIIIITAAFVIGWAACEVNHLRIDLGKMRDADRQQDQWHTQQGAK